MQKLAADVFACKFGPAVENSPASSYAKLLDIEVNDMNAGHTIGGPVLRNVAGAIQYSEDDNSITVIQVAINVTGKFKRSILHNSRDFRDDRDVAR